VKTEGLTTDQLFKSCQRVQQMDMQSLMCLDWILASTEYVEFVNMMMEFKGIQDWDGEDFDYSRTQIQDEEGEEEEQS
jgi:hypothetical protein